MEDEYPITNVPQESLTVHLPRGDLVFKRKNGMHVADWTAYSNVFSTTSVYTRAEEERARKAYELARISGFPSMNELVHLVEDGYIVGMPALTCNNVLRAYDLYRTPPAYICGKLTKKLIKHAVIDASLMMLEKKQRTQM